jgi:hypothetical protein
MEQLASTWICHLLHPSVGLHMTLYPAALVISTIQPTDYMMKIDLRSVFVSNLHRSRTSQILWDLLLNEYICIDIQWTIPWPLLSSSTLPKRWLEYFTNALMSQWLPAWMTGSSRVLSYQPQTWSTPLRTWATPSIKPNLYFEKQLLSHTWDFRLTSCVCTLNLQPDVFIIYWKCWLSFCRLHPKIFDVSQDTQYGSRGVLVGHLTAATHILQWFTCWYRCLNMQGNTTCRIHYSRYIFTWTWLLLSSRPPLVTLMAASTTLPTAQTNCGNYDGSSIHWPCLGIPSISTNGCFHYARGQNCSILYFTYSKGLQPAQ